MPVRLLWQSATAINTMSALAPISQQDPLAQLRDIHLPQAVSAWPPAWGWWALAVLVSALFIIALTFLLRRYRRNAYRRQALKQLAAINSHRLKRQHQLYLQQLNQLLKQTALAADQPQAAGLSGEAWLNFLDTSGNTNAFTQGAGSVLLNGPYQAEVTVDDDLSPLHELAKQWLKGHRAPC